MLAGVVRYLSEDVLVDTKAMIGLAKTMEGVPVVVEHQDIDDANLRTQADGYVTESFYNELDGCLWAKMLVISDNAKQKIREGWGVSNCYEVKKWGDSGIHNNLPYNREVEGGEFQHLAIVQNPRYEKAVILTPEKFKEYQQSRKAELEQLINSKEPAKTINNQQEENKMSIISKLFKNKKEEVTAIDAETFVELKNDKGEVEEVTIQSMIDALVNAKKKNEDEDKKEKELENQDSEVDVEGEKMPLKELINRYSEMKNKCKNEADEEEKKKKEEEEKENAKKKNEKEAEEGSQYFEELKNAADKKFAATEFESTIDKIARGKERYGVNK